MQNAEELAGFEPEIEEVLNDPIIRLMMESDHVEVETLPFVPTSIRFAKPANS